MIQKLKDVNLIVIHCSATKESQNYTFEQLKKDHRLRGFTACGYHVYIRRDGTVHPGRPFTTVGAHVAGHNKNSIGICYEGGLDDKGKAKDTRTEEQKHEILLQILSVANQIKRAGGQVHAIRITGHRNLSPDKNGNGVVEPDEWIKQCPCFEAELEYKDVTKTI